MKIGLVQYNPSWEMKEENKGKIRNLLSSAEKNYSLMIFPEMTLTGFTMNAAGLSEEINGESFNFFSEIALNFSSHVIAGIIEKSNNNFYNSLIHIDPSGALINTYRKIHPFSYSDEDKNYTKGKEPVITSINEFSTGLSICYDLRFPELFRFYGKKKVELILVIANWPVPRIEHWWALLKARAIENLCYVAGVNRVGSDPKSVYSGFSSVYDPMGNELITSENMEEIITAEIYIDVVNEVRNKLPFLNDISMI